MSDRHETTLDADGFEWDENKRVTNLAKHGFDFEDVTVVFLEPHIDFALKFRAEPRRQATGVVDGRCVAVIYTMRGRTIRIISARRARENEERVYRATLARGDP